MYGYRKNISLVLAIFFLLLMNYSCVQSITEPQSKNIEILNTSIELDRFENELYLQIETNQNYSQNFIHEVFMELTYIGDVVHGYSKTFKLYDNGENGDLISANGIYTLLTHADTVVLPDIESEITNIDMAENFMLDETNSDSLDISVTINGKAFQCLASVLDIYNKITFLDTNVNLDNSYIELMINSDYMYMDNPQTSACDRSQKETPDPNAFESYFEWANGTLSESSSNQFVFSTQIPFRSLNDCGGTGKAIFRFILHDLDTNSEIIADDIELIIYGCGDGVCESGLEGTSSCPEDCQ
ncbi:MAG: hypothetical protein QF380_05750 [Candidatus Marinimicrobia bacterium]|jgi:hypothetical protein|nr:hypothetical protein [Candidatus Neomarinimicrobiota bacterium]